MSDCKCPVYWHCLCLVSLVSMRPCILNLNLNVRVRILVGTSFLRFPKFDFNVIFFGKFGIEQILNIP